MFDLPYPRKINTVIRCPKTYVETKMTCGHTKLEALIDEYLPEEKKRRSSGNFKPRKTVKLGAGGYEQHLRLAKSLLSEIRKNNSINFVVDTDAEVVKTGSGYLIPIKRP